MRHTRAQALSLALATALPGRSDTLLLRGCLHSGDAGRSALQEWLAMHDTPQREACRPSTKWLLPLLFRACCMHGIKPDASLLVVLKAAALREELRTRSYQVIAREALRILQECGLEPIVLKGAALAEEVYPDPSLRHSHDLEMLANPPAWRDTVAALARGGFSCARYSDRAARLHLVHGSGLPVILHRRVFAIRFYNAVHDRLVARAQKATVAGLPTRTLAPADALLHTCAHGASSVSGESCRWVVDGWFLTCRRVVDWQCLLETAAAAHLALPMWVRLRYLKDAVHAPVPAWVIAEAETMAAAARSPGPELALLGARSARRRSVTGLIASTPGLRPKLAVLRYFMLPSLAYLQWATRTSSPWMRPALRTARGISRRLFPAD